MSLWYLINQSHGQGKNPTIFLLLRQNNGKRVPWNGSKQRKEVKSPNLHSAHGKVSLTSFPIRKIWHLVLSFWSRLGKPYHGICSQAIAEWLGLLFWKSPTEGIPILPKRLLKHHASARKIPTIIVISLCWGKPYKVLISAMPLGSIPIPDCAKYRVFCFLPQKSKRKFPGKTLFDS